jgi:hypothetical protein
MKPLASLLFMAAYVGGCARPVLRAPPEVSVKVGRLQATNRDWSKVQVCFTEREPVQADIDSMTRLLKAFVDQTSLSVQESWPDDQLSMLEQSPAVLAPTLSVQRSSLAALKKAQNECRFKNVELALKVNASAQKRIDEAPQLVAQIRGARALVAWQSGLTPARDAAKARCGTAKTKPSKPECYYATEDQVGKLEWRFCDGSMVVAGPGVPPAYVAAPEVTLAKGKKPKVSFKPEDYLKVASERAHEAIDKAPRAVPKIGLKPDDGQPEPSDG